MLQALFGGMMGLSLLYGLIVGRGEQVASAMLEGAEEAVQAAFAMAGAFAFFCGMTAILRRAGAIQALGKRLSPLLSRLLGPDLPPDALEPVLLNLSANLLGLGNAATPMGVEAARRMGGSGDRASNALCLFLVINSSSVQLLPTTVIALRAAEGSISPAAITLPALAATTISTVIGIAACKLAEARPWG
ncbi:MAG: spore maturation protein A [Clostridia bacterium]|nr:spore maturation protein A [Clostridia bacterium]